jgi:lipopolysaccharide/colanic/teichoic acid biosynthesis glycosyltransferase
MTIFDSLMLQKSLFAAWEGQGVPANCFLYWRQGQLLVQHSSLQARSHSFRQHSQPQLPPLSNQQWLVECLKRSPVRLVRVDIDLGEHDLETWAEACETSGKAMYLRLPSAAHLPQRRTRLLWRYKRVCDWGIAVLALGLFSPVMIGMAIAIALTSPGPILISQWRVGNRGKLFKALKFRTIATDTATQPTNYRHKRDSAPRLTSLGRWIQHYRLDTLPQLINVVRGEMSLVGPCPWTLKDAVRIRPELRSRLNALPGITGAWPVEAQTIGYDSDAVSDRDLQYLRNWSLQRDFKILLQAVPKMLSGFRTY